MAIGRALIGLATALLVAAALAPMAAADPTATTDPTSLDSAAPGGDSGGPSVPAARISAADPLNGGYLIVNMHGMLFHPLDSDIQEDVSYARWLGSGVIRVFGTDNNGLSQWDGTRVGNRIADIAPMLRAGHMRLIVALVNNHRAVPGEALDSWGWMDGYIQLLLPFYTGNWRGAYAEFLREVISTVQARHALDVIYAWELGNELHTPRQPEALMPFITQAVQAVRALDPATPILPGTMGANHVEPGNHASPIARWLYCEAPVDAYTLHAYDWVSRARPGDMPIDWDLDNIVSTPCPNGRALPVIVEELGTSRSLPGVYSADDEQARLAQEQRQIQFVRQFPQVVGFGVWNGESPRLQDRTFVDTRRGLTSYGPQAQGGGSCYDPRPALSPGVRCQLEQVYRGLHFVRVGASASWAASTPIDGSDPLLGAVDPVSVGDAPDSLSLSGWVLDPTAVGSTGVTGVDIVLGQPTAGSVPLAQAQLGLARTDVSAQFSTDADGAPLDPGFSLQVPLAALPSGVDTLTLEAHTDDGSTWLSTLQLVLPALGGVPPLPSASPVAPLPPLSPVPSPAVQIAAPAPGSDVGKTFLLEGLAPTMDRIDVFLEPDRDLGGQLVGSASLSQQTGPSFRASVSVPKGPHTLYIHAHSAVTGQESVLTLPITVS